MKPIVIYHGNCADGFGAAWAAYRYYGSEGADFVPGFYDQPPPNVIGREVNLLDFSYKRPVIEAMLKDATLIRIVDHHKSAIEDLMDLHAINFKKHFSMEKSGALLAWENFHGASRPPRLLEYISDRDLYEFKLPNSRAVAAALFSYPYSFSTWDLLMERDIASFVDEGTAILRKHNKDIAELLTVVTRPMVIGGYAVPAANLPYTMTSEAAASLCKIHQSPFAACYYDTPNGRQFGLRSLLGGVDVAKVAQGYGGGGHEHSAGFLLSYDRLHEFECGYSNTIKDSSDGQESRDTGAPRDGKDSILDGGDEQVA